MHPMIQTVLLIHFKIQSGILFTVVGTQPNQVARFNVGFLFLCRFELFTRAFIWRFTRTVAQAIFPVVILLVHDSFARSWPLTFEIFLVLVCTWAYHGITPDKCIVFVISKAFILTKGASHLLLDARATDVGQKVGSLVAHFYHVFPCSRSFMWLWQAMFHWTTHLNLNNIINKFRLR